MCLLAYTGFLRFNELSSIRLGHVTFNGEGLKLFIPSSKTDMYHDGRSVVVSNTYTKYCPVETLEKYITLAQIKSVDSFLFRSLSEVRQGYKLREANQPMSYTRVREVILDALRPVVDDVSKFGVKPTVSGQVVPQWPLNQVFQIDYLRDTEGGRVKMRKTGTLRTASVICCQCLKRLVCESFS